MRKWITLLMTFLVGASSYVNATNGQVTLEAGYRRDNISWRLRAPARDPVLTSSRRFKDLDIFQLSLQGRTIIGYNFYIRANAYWGWILDGDFKRDAHTYQSVSGLSNDVRFGFTNEGRTVIDDKYVFGVGAAIGYPFYFCDCTTVVAPVIGYAFDEQSVQFDSADFGNFVSYESSNNNHCCRQTFNSRWYGPFVGVDFNYRPYNECWSLYADFEFHWGTFRGRKNGTDGFDEDTFNGNRSSHDAKGWVVDVGAEYDICNCWTVGLSFKYQDWQANRNHREFHGSGSSYGSSSSNHGVRTRTNNRWDSYAINLTFGREF